MTASAARRRASFFLALSGCLVTASLVLELLWRSHLREAIELGPLTPPQMQADIASELQMFAIGMKALAIGRMLVALPTAVVWVLWLVEVRRRLAVVAMWSACTVATVAVWAYSYRETRTFARRAGPGLPREAILKLLSEGADVVVRTDLALLAVALAALALVRRASVR